MVVDNDVNLCILIIHGKILAAIDHFQFISRSLSNRSIWV